MEDKGKETSENKEAMREKCVIFCALKPKLIYNALLVAILILYGVFGGFVFKSFEASSIEAAKESQVTAKQTFLNREDFLQLIWQDNNHNDALTYEEWAKQANEKLDEYEAGIRKSEQSEPDPVVNWSLADSWLFACTVFTTVGYGNIAPLTIKGRVFCMLYGAVGIPLFSVVAGSLASFVTEIIHALHKEYHRRKRHESAAMHKKDDVIAPDEPVPELEIKLKHVAVVVAGYLCIGAVLFCICEGWSLFESFYYCFITLSTVGLGDYVPQHIHHTLPFGAFILVGLVLVVMLFGSLEEVITRQLEKVKRVIGVKEE
ncbi:predicted protein [Nematostella vectensis]|uniref:Potassium channel domain-containing protein n=1 Tax=Nematostella vectensis TaxID=45351 RepID=A7RIT3_NEMVE|nr:predicted protein [Nematostella vectensis]|eukprot:XP_001640627.1 predicted protein [Nematostella vectensis]